MPLEYVNIKTSKLNKNVPTKETFQTVFPSPCKLTLAAADWDTDNKTITVTCTGVLDDEEKQLITISPSIDNREDYVNAGIYCYSQAEDSLTFKCNAIPTTDIVIYAILETLKEYEAPKPLKIYGAEWTNKTKSPTWTRTDDAASFSDPVKTTSTIDEQTAYTFTSPFDNISPWSDMQIVEDSQAGTMVSIPKFYYKLTEYKKNDSDTYTTIKLQISDQQFEGSSTSPAHADRGDGKGERDVVYVARYHANGDSKSKAGVSPIQISPSNIMKSVVPNLPENCYVTDYAMLVTIQMLFLVEFATWNSQIIGMGVGMKGESTLASGVMGAICNNGLTDNLNSPTGSYYRYTFTTNSGEQTVDGAVVQYRHIENLWSNLSDFIIGIISTNDYGFYITNKPNLFSKTGETTEGFTKEEGKELYYSIPDVVKKSTSFDWLLIPDSTTDDLTTPNIYTCDQHGISGEADSAYAFGGNYTYVDKYAIDYQLALSGLFQILLNTSNYGDGIGYRTMILP